MFSDDLFIAELFWLQERDLNTEKSIVHKYASLYIALVVAVIVFSGLNEICLIFSPQFVYPKPHKILKFQLYFYIYD